jgi:hypothetical protein
MTVQEYAAISATLFGVAADPGQIAHIAMGTDDVEAAPLVRLHGKLKRIHVTRLNCDKACKKLILASYANMYTEALEDTFLGYANVTPLDLIVYLRLTYYRIAPMQLADCYNRTTNPYDMQDPLESLFSQIDAGVRYANAGGQPYFEAQYVNIVFILVLTTGVAPLACV